MLLHASSCRILVRPASENKKGRCGHELVSSRYYETTNYRSAPPFVDGSSTPPSQRTCVSPPAYPTSLPCGTATIFEGIVSLLKVARPFPS